MASQKLSITYVVHYVALTSYLSAIFVLEAEQLQYQLNPAMSGTFYIDTDWAYLYPPHEYTSVLLDHRYIGRKRNMASSYIYNIVCTC